MQINSAERGQVLLVVVLIITVVLTVSMSVLARSVVNSRLSSEEDKSVKALSAAEAGIERTLLAGSPDTISIPFGDGTSFTTTNKPITDSKFLLNNGRLIEKDEGADVWLSTYTSGNYTNPWSGTLNIYWGSSDCTASPLPAAIEVLLITNSVSPVLTHYVYDPCNRNNNFTPVSAGSYAVAGKSFIYTAQIIVVNGLLARVVPLYTNSYIAVQNGLGNSNFPLQGVLIESVGTSGNVKRKVSLFQENPSLPSELFMYAFLWPKKTN